MKRAFVIGLLVFGVFGCGGDDGKAPFVPPHRKDSGPRESVDAGPKQDAGIAPSNGPVLKFTAPEAANDPSDDTVITSRTVSVRCSATQRPGSKSDVDHSSVAITLEKPGAADMRITSAVAALANDEYEAKFDLSSIPNGVLRFHCDANDVASTPNKTSITLETLLDLGPTIEIIEPKDKKVYARKTPVAITFNVKPAPLGDEDTEADVEQVKLQVSGIEIPLTETDGKPGSYQTSVNFADKALFNVPPTSAEVLATATNRRSPEAATRVVKYDIEIDGEGPSIKVEEPADLSIVHGEVTLRLSVQDVSNVEPGSLRAQIGNLTIVDWEQMGASYQQKFDTRNFSATMTQLTINITARDVVGNENSISHFLRLDNFPPILSLDPPLIREWRKSGSNYFCSEAFDPLGKATSDGDLSLVASRYRVLVEDRTNVAITATGGNFGYYAGVARDKVILYAQRDPSIPLLIDTDGNGVCDEINFNELPPNQQPVFVELSPLDPRGVAWYSKTVNFHEPANDVSAWQSRSGKECKQDPGGPDEEPMKICPSTDMFRVIAGEGEDHPPAVYALNPTNGGTGECEGGFWELLPMVDEGWVCLAARAEDRIGNIGVSAPLRVCFDDIDTPAHACDQNNTGSRPACTGNCTIAPDQRFSSNYVWQQP